MKNNYRFVLFFVFGLVISNIIGCAASVQTEQYVGEYEKQKSMDEVVVTKVDGLKILEVRANKEMEERYKLMSSLNVKNINSYNEKSKKILSTGKKLYKNVQTGIDEETRQAIFEKDF
mgnify:CR=1 FL=1